MSCGCGIVFWFSIVLGVDACCSACLMIVSWSLGMVSRFVCGSGVGSKVGDCGDTFSCMFSEMGGSPSAPCR